MTTKDLQNPALTFLGNKSPGHLHERLKYHAKRENNVEIRNILVPQLLHSLMPENDPLFGKLEAWLHGTTPASHLALSWGRVGACGASGTAPAPHLAPSWGRVGKGSATPAPHLAPSWGRMGKGSATSASHHLAPSWGRMGMRVVSEPGRDAPLATAGTEGGAALPRPRPIGEDLALRTAALRARAQARGAAFPASLRTLRAKCKVTEAGDSWPTLFAEEALDRLTRLLDEDGRPPRHLSEGDYA